MIIVFQCKYHNQVLSFSDFFRNNKFRERFIPFHNTSCFIAASANHQSLLCHNDLYILIVRQISARHNVLLNSIGPTQEEVDCYDRAVWMFWLVIISFLVGSLLEILCHLIFAYHVRNKLVFQPLKLWFWF